MTTQIRNSELVDLLTQDFQHRNEPNFAWRAACSMFQALPGLRGFWPMSSVLYTALNQAQDLSFQGNDLTNANASLFGSTDLAPWVFMDGVNQRLYRADGGAANWADILGTEAYISGQALTAGATQGLTIGGWFQVDTFNAVSVTGLIAKWGVAGPIDQRSYGLFLNTPGGTAPVFQVSSLGTAASVVFQNSSISLAADAWYFIVGRYEPSAQIDVFVNMDQDTNAVATPANLFDGTEDFEIGCYDGALANSFLYGYASMCFLCAAALPDVTIFSLYEQTRRMYGV